MSREIIGMSKIAVQNKITLIEDVVKILNTNVGDRIVYFLNKESGKVEIERSRNNDP